jgi:hypothetical protein
VPDDTSAARPSSGFQRFRDRLVGHAPDTALRRDIPEPLAPVLRHWITLACQHDDQAAQRAALRLRIAPKLDRHGRHSFVTALHEADGHPDLLDVVDAILKVHRAPDWFQSNLAETAENYAHLIVNLIDALEDANSAFTVAGNYRQLVERVDLTATTAAEYALENAPPTAGTLLREAWNQAYGLDPDPTSAYGDAVRAVEHVACPLVLPKDEVGTLGKVIRHLQQGGHKWQFVLVDGDGTGTIDPLVAMLDRLWTGQVSRHGGGQQSREQTKAEAEAAVHLAATLVQLLTIGALTRRDTP